MLCYIGIRYPGTRIARHFAHTTSRRTLFLACILGSRFHQSQRRRANDGKIQVTATRLRSLLACISLFWLSAVSVDLTSPD